MWSSVLLGCTLTCLTIWSVESKPLNKDGSLSQEQKFAEALGDVGFYLQFLSEHDKGRGANVADDRFMQYFLDGGKKAGNSGHNVKGLKEKKKSGKDVFWRKSRGGDADYWERSGWGGGYGK